MFCLAPPGGAIAASWIGREIDASHVISADMGGTSFDVAVILDGEPALSEQKEFTYGIPSRIPMIDIETIGAGGGSIIYQDRVGILHVGPESAGAEPGPISYARGGTRPTVTDANILLGRLDIQNVLPGADSPRPIVHAAFEQLGAALGTTAEGAAQAAIRVIDLNMAGAIRKITLERGLDTRKFVLIPFGGAGPLHACSIAENLRVPRVLVPIWPGVTSALGCLLADIRYDDTWTVHQRLDQINLARIRALYDRMVERVMGVMREDGVPDEKVKLRYEAALQYEGQTHRVMITLPSPDITVADLGEAFMTEYRERYGVTVANVPVRLVNLRVRASAPRDVSVSIAGDPMRGSNANGATSARMFFANAWHRLGHSSPRIAQGGCGRRRACAYRPDRHYHHRSPGWTARVDPRGNIAITHEAFQQ